MKEGEGQQVRVHTSQMVTFIGCTVCVCVCVCGGGGGVWVSRL